MCKTNRRNEKNGRCKKSYVMVMLVIGMLLLTGCAFINDWPFGFINAGPLMEAHEVTVIADIAYDVNPHLGYTVFILEDGRYVPYLVLTNDYNGHTLLLRKHLLDEFMRYSPPEGTAGFAAYYGDSELGNFLNDEFFYLFCESLQARIVNSSIEITARHSLRALADNDLEIIERRVFLLSMTETGGRHRSRMVEGRKLDYFSTIERRIANTASGHIESWWVRTPHTGSMPDQPGIISWSGYQTIGSTLTIFGYTELGVRPAFSLPNDTPIIRGELEGETVFFIGN